MQDHFLENLFFFEMHFIGFDVCPISFKIVPLNIEIWAFSYVVFFATWKRHFMGPASKRSRWYFYSSQRRVNIQSGLSVRLVLTRNPHRTSGFEFNPHSSIFSSKAFSNFSCSHSVVASNPNFYLHIFFISNPIFESSFELLSKFPKWGSKLLWSC